MTREEAKAKFKEIIETEIDRMANHYDVDVVYSNVDKIEELLELNKIVCEALEKQIPKYPDVEFCRKHNDYEFEICRYRAYRCPSCGTRVHIQSYCMHCGQAIKGGSGMEADFMNIDEVAHDTEKTD